VRFDAIGLLWATEHETGESESIFQAHLLAKAMGPRATIMAWLLF
jgi:hypothetical protein